MQRFSLYRFKINSRSERRDFKKNPGTYEQEKALLPLPRNE